MKVRAIGGTTELEVVGETDRYWLCHLPNYQHPHCFLKSEYEPIKIKQWQDVTEECEVNAQGYLCHTDKHGVIRRVCQADGYRFCKVQVYESYNNSGNPLGNPKWVFLIECKIP